MCQPWWAAKSMYLSARICSTRARMPVINAGKSTGPASVRIPGKGMMSGDVPCLRGD
jgi:hypothetical protein